MENFLNSLKFIKQAFAFLYRNKDLISLGMVLLVAIIYVLFSIKEMLTVADDINAISLVVATYFIITFIITYYEAILIAVIIKRLNEQSHPIWKEIYNSRRYLFSILCWSLVLSTIGFFNKLLNSTRIMPFSFFKQRYYTSSSLLSYMPGSWNFATFFVLPMLVTEKIGLKRAFQQSDALFGPGWQKNFRVSPIIGMGCLFTIILYCTVANVGILTSFNWLSVLIILVFFAIIAVTLNAVEKSVLYRCYILHKQTNQFEQGLLNSAYSRMSEPFDSFF